VTQILGAKFMARRDARPSIAEAADTRMTYLCFILRKAIIVVIVLALLCALALLVVLPLLFV
jgi:hypothetical protein